MKKNNLFSLKKISYFCAIKNLKNETIYFRRKQLETHQGNRF